MIKPSSIRTHAGHPLSGYIAELCRETIPPKVYYFRVMRRDGSLVTQPIGPFETLEEAVKTAHRWPGEIEKEEVEDVKV